MGPLVTVFLRGHLSADVSPRCPRLRAQRRDPGGGLRSPASQKPRLVPWNKKSPQNGGTTRQGYTTQPLAAVSQTPLRKHRCWETWSHGVLKDQQCQQGTRKASCSRENVQTPPGEVKLLTLERAGFHVKINFIVHVCSCRSQPEAGKRTCSWLGVPEAAGNVEGKMAKACWFWGHTTCRLPRALCYPTWIQLQPPCQANTWKCSVTAPNPEQTASASHEHGQETLTRVERWSFQSTVLLVYLV